MINSIKARASALDSTKIPWSANKMKKASKIQERFRKYFGSEVRFYRAPGRVNLIAEHTDYNYCFALPTAIDLHCLGGSQAAIGHTTRYPLRCI